MKEIKRVVKKEGQIWINFGDCFGGSPAGNKSISEANQGYDGVFVRKAKQGQGAKSFVFSTDNERMFSGKSNMSRLKQTAGEKCLLMMPERFTIRCIDELGLILRNKIKWAKQILDYKRQRTMGSVMPTSVKDRFNESGEELYFFVKNKKYYSNLDAVRMKNQVLGVTDFREDTHHLGSGFVRTPELYPNSKYRGKFRANENAESFNSPRARTQRKGLDERMADTKNKDQKSSRTYNIKKLLSEVRLGIKPNTGMEKYKCDNGEGLLNKKGLRGGGQLSEAYKDKEIKGNVFGKNLPTIWLIGSEPHNFQKEVGAEVDHFATFPEALCEIPIKFGCPKNGIVLDPFCGSGTALIVAKKLKRNFIGIELNRNYITISKARLDATPTPLL